MNLLLFTILCTLTFAAQIGLTMEQGTGDIRTIAMLCKDGTGATDDDVEAFLNHELSTNMNAMCLRACILKKVDLMDDNGKIANDLATKFEHNVLGDTIKFDIVVQIVDACKDLTVSDNHCEAAEQYWECVKTECDRRGISTTVFRI